MSSVPSNPGSQDNQGPDEEPWEAEICNILGRMPLIDPPPGFLDRAIDHRPLHAGRTLAGLSGVSIAAIAAIVLSGAAARTTVVPQIEELARRHTTVQAGVFASPVSEVDYPVETPVEMPAGFQRTLNLTVEDIRQAFYDGGDGAVSVFVQSGGVRWDSLPPDGIRDIDGLTVWVDDRRQVTVLETSNETVTIVGLAVEDAAAVLAEIPRADDSLADRAQELVEAITGQLGYPDLS